MKVLYISLSLSRLDHHCAQTSSLLVLRLVSFFVSFILFRIVVSFVKLCFVWVR